MMVHPKHMHHVQHSFLVSYPVSLTHRFYVIVLGPLAIVALMYCLYTFYPHFPKGEEISLSTMLIATFYTMMRLAIAYAIAIIVAIPLAILTVSNRTLEALLLPVFDVLESVPILALFPLVILLFIQFDFINGAAIFILFLNMLWNIVFAIVGGLKIIPKDITYAGQIFGITGLSYVRRIMLPAIFPQLVTGSILAVAEGWNLIIVVEALHTYIPGGTSAQDLFGIGSILVAAASNGQNSVLLMAVLVMVIIIGLFNFFVWQKLLHYAQRFRFE